MALQFPVADIMGNIDRGRNFAQAERMRPINEESARLGVEQQQQNLTTGGLQREQALVTGGLQQQNIQGQIDQRTDDQKNQSLYRTAFQVGQLKEEEMVPFFDKKIAEIKAMGGNSAESEQGRRLAMDGKYQDVYDGALNILNTGRNQGDLPPLQETDNTSAEQRTFDNLIKDFSPEDQVLARRREAGLDARATTASEQAVIPPVLLSGLSNDVAEKGSAAFTAAGGGKDGLNAFQKIVDAGSEQEKRIASPQILKSSFPKASPAEMVQLQATMDSANNTQEGLKLASKLRVDQRRDLKGKDFQIKAIDLLDNILKNDQLSDVIGSIEGGIDFRLFSDAESELIADIEEAKNILTADNLSLMSGVLSESDIRILANLSGGALNRKRTEKRFTTDVTSLRDRLKSKMIVTADDTANDRRNSINLPPSGREGGVLQIDAAGNRAFVFPDGTFEEI
jgi:hypothetical protein